VGLPLYAAVEERVDAIGPALQASYHVEVLQAAARLWTIAGKMKGSKRHFVVEDGQKCSSD
jgi:hypothetical protein